MATSLNPRVEYELKELISDLAGRDHTISETAADLIQIGVTIRKEELEPEIVGPLGIPRPFAKISLGDQTGELRTEISDALADELVSEFDNKPNTATREAIRLGILAVAEDEFTVEGPAGGPRPFAQIEFETLEDAEVLNLIKDLQARL
ncbi:hypothetical protein [Haloarcula sebkhae]|uniref:Uncharacterized protein n=2 Tax=Haloarcula sebkhae TaxID=932660 RepID=A0ACC6VPC7_9EURY|nr:hypothetical protein [Haloarcula sebkhae]GGK82834.1 hypothetical protein GCM10009067_38840 [Haloarcula sebkhae]